MVEGHGTGSTPCVEPAKCFFCWPWRHAARVGTGRRRRSPGRKDARVRVELVDVEAQRQPLRPQKTRSLALGRGDGRRAAPGLRVGSGLRHAGLLPWVALCSCWVGHDLLLLRTRGWRAAAGRSGESEAREQLGEVQATMGRREALGEVDLTLGR
jgi:hypothetical protein